VGRCGCDGTCQCALSSTACLAVTGVGTPTSPILISPVISPDAINRLECRANGLYAGDWAKTATVATSQTTSSATFTDLATVGPAVTVTTGTAAIIIIGCEGAVNNTSGYQMAFAVSGATTRAAASTEQLGIGSGAVASLALAMGRTVMLTALTAGSNVFTAKYKCGNAAHIATFLNRDIIVIPINALP
jgi:hypothetical protein